MCFFRDEKVVTTSDGSVIVCWHPEPKFPYEMTRPVPRTQPQAQAENHLKVQHVEDMKSLYRFKHPRLQRRDLMKLTWTPKHAWDPYTTHIRSRKEEKIPRERPYL